MTESTADDHPRGLRETVSIADRLSSLLREPLLPDELRALVQDAVSQLEALTAEVDEARKREVALQGLYERYVDLFNQAPIGYIVLDSRGDVSEANVTLARMLGVTPSRLTQQGFTDFVAAESRETYRQHREAICGTGLPRAGMLTLRRVDGTHINVQMNAQPVTGADGRMAWCQISFSDVTERVATLTALKQSELRLKRAHEVAKLGYWDWHPLADVLYWSDGLYPIFERDPADFTPTLAAVDAMVHPEDRDHYVAERSRMLLQETPVVMSYRIVCLDGTVRHIQEATEFVRDEHGNVERVAGTVQDVTDHKEVENALRETNERLASALADLESAQAQLVRQERLAAVGQLSVGIAHDFNNVLASILLYSQISQRDEDLDSVHRDRLSVISEEARRGAALVQQVLDFGRRAVIERRPIVVATFLEDVVALLRRTLPESIHVETDIGAGPNGGIGDALINVDPTRLQQALINLALNSREAMPGGGVLRIQLTRTPPNTWVSCVTCDRRFAGEWMVLSVSDTGVGIPERDLPLIFEPFFTTRRPLGHGLGLPQVLGIVEQQDGHIKVDTKVGQGTTFSLHFPVLTEAPAEAMWQEALEVIDGAGQTILVAEDNDATRQAILDVLEMLQYRTVAARNGQEALDLLLADDAGIALVVCDWVMPLMGGEALVAAIQSRSLSVPLVMITGHTLTEDAIQAMPEGVVAWLQKPVTLERLSEAVAKALAGNRLPAKDARS